MKETWDRCLGREDPLEKEMLVHSSILDWEIPWTEGLGGLQSMRLQRVGHSFCFYGAKKSKCNGKYFVVIEFNNKRSLEVYRYIPFCLFT